MSADKPIRIGVVGVGRGMSFADMAPHVGMELVALCDTWEARLLEVGKRLNVATYVDFDRFLEHDMDAVVLANYFHQHAPLAVKALQAGKHVMSETMACKTLGEGVALARAVEKSVKIYMFAENYAYFACVQEMRRLYQLGEIGEVRYAEGEYIHPMDWTSWFQISPGINHWRRHIPPTYYCTHAMAPIMFVTDTRPVSVNSLSITHTDDDKSQPFVVFSDAFSVTICRMDDGSVSRITGVGGSGGHSIWYRFHGKRGRMENMRTGDTGMLRVLHDEWDLREGEEVEKIYLPDFPVHADLARAAGHGGGDFFTAYHFAEAIRQDQQPYMDVYRGIAMTLVGIQAWRSCHANGAPVEIPDFRDESIRAKHANDDWSPFPEDRRPGQPWPSILGEFKPRPEAVAFARKVWKEMGYEGE